ncbi:hypothetical protein JMJ77_0004385 [Colletotrichum scovillei]|uniref:Uncharacterized protein n=1 Tax=Colletotrichum scovillei TaxID=1209932 RepID=A0A9P7QXE3_9PEZI|nr:hypothetical protein JMJ77_0004385 [Colletotrichum scovillei]KAG7049639.1 hypothetical protein JMJ78_0013618 [Colletotrichum scovillei]KAG7064381.1 hypothetical protein JMJ76_0007425 [Colletotrichum scovillei]
MDPVEKATAENGHFSAAFVQRPNVPRRPLEGNGTLSSRHDTQAKPQVRVTYGVSRSDASTILQTQSPSSD